MIKAIETVYNGYRFRSRLEARWAVFFDTLGIKWEYEKEGYELDGLLYLPDFWLPEQDCWVEIKGENPTGSENLKAQLLADHTGKNVYIFVGEIKAPSWDSDFSSEELNVVYESKGWDYMQLWCECPHCYRIGIKFEGRADRLCNCKETIKGTNYGRGHNFDSPRLLAAYTAARQARFEHEEGGR